MSNYLPPIRKGSEVLTGYMHPPTKVVFQGVPPGSSAPHELYKAFAPQINHFHRSQAQKYSLSPIENYRAYGVYLGLRMTYTNLHGQETIHIEVETQGGQPVVVPSDYWDFADIEILVEGVPQVQSSFGWAGGIFAAYITSPNVSGDITVDTFNARGVASTIQQSQDTLIMFADDPFGPSIPQLAQVDDGLYGASLRVDLRPFRGLSAVTIDLYGYMSPYFSDGPIVGRTAAAMVGRHGTFGSPDILRIYTDHDRVIALYPELDAVWGANWYQYTPSDPGWATHLNDGGYGYDYTWTVASTPGNWFGGANPNGERPFFGHTIETVPIAYFDGTTLASIEYSNYWEWIDLTPPTGPEARTDSIPEPPPGFNGVNPYTVSFYWTDNYTYYEPTYGDGGTFYPNYPAEVRGALFKGNPMTGRSLHYNDNNNASYRRWESQAAYPNRWGTGKLGDVSLISQDTDVDHYYLLYHYGMPKLGTVTIDLIHGGMSFKAA